MVLGAAGGLAVGAVAGAVIAHELSEYLLWILQYLQALTLHEPQPRMIRGASTAAIMRPTLRPLLLGMRDMLQRRLRPMATTERLLRESCQCIT